MGWYLMSWLLCHVDVSKCQNTPACIDSAFAVVAAQNKRQTNAPTHTALLKYCLSEFMASSKRAQASAPTVEDFINEGKEVQNQSGRSLATDQTEDRLFREFFGCGAPIALQLWNLLDENGFVPESGQICHLLWTLFFMKQYPTEGVECGAVGGSKGRVDPKTYRKWVHPFMEALSDLQPYVVSFIFFFCIVGY